MSYYCNLSLPDDGHAGTDIDPWSMGDLGSYASSGAVSDTVYLKGTYESDALYVDPLISNLTLLPWDPETNGPWRIKALYTKYDPFMFPPSQTIKGTILTSSQTSDNNGGTQFILNGTTNKLLASSFIWNYSSNTNEVFFIRSLGAGDLYIKGCVLGGQGTGIQGNVFVNDTGGDTEFVFEDCIFQYEGNTLPIWSDSGSTLTVRLRNCHINLSQASFRSQASGLVTFIDENVTYEGSLLTLPAWNAPNKEDWDYDTLFSSIPTPPQPGYGSPSYTDYDKGFWGGSRSGIGVGYFSFVPIAPTADFSGTPLSGTEPLTVAFTDSSTETPTSWAWTFGDGDTSTDQNPSHEYVNDGTYTVTLTATNSAGSSDPEEKIDYITVSNAPTPPTPRLQRKYTPSPRRRRGISDAGTRARQELTRQQLRQSLPDVYR